MLKLLWKKFYNTVPLSNKIHTYKNNMYFISKDIFYTQNAGLWKKGKIKQQKPTGWESSMNWEIHLMQLYTPWEPKENKLSVPNECTFAVFQGYKDEWAKVVLLSWSGFKKLRSLPHGKGIQGMCENTISYYLKMHTIILVLRQTMQL